MRWYFSDRQCMGFRSTIPTQYISIFTPKREESNPTGSYTTHILFTKGKPAPNVR
jgi:hypothetical protein